MRCFRRTSLLLLVLLLGVFACEVPGVSIIDPVAQATSVAQTLDAIIAATQTALSQTPLPPSETPTITFTAQPPTATSIPTLTETPTITLTPVPIYTATPLVPMISVTVPTNCRTGPGKVYDRVGALLVGEVAQVYGRDPTGMFWYIRNPDSPGEYCWVWGQYAILSGPTWLLPIYTPPPTPTPTFTPTPAPGFDVSYEGLVSCASAWWVEIRLKNTGLITFQSVGLTVKDTVTDTSVSDISDDFTDRETCATSVSKGSLLPGKAATVSSPEFSYNPSGHKLRATITLCSKDGQNGICLTQTITFKP